MIRLVFPSQRSINTRGPFGLLRVRTRPGQRTKGLLTAGRLSIPVSLGRGGIRADKREGDGGTPRGLFQLRQLWWRADRAPRPRTRLPVRPIRPDDAWSEDPADRRYNRPVRRRPSEPGDRLMREDALYDLILEIDHNDRPRGVPPSPSRLLATIPARPSATGRVKDPALKMPRVLAPDRARTRI